MMTRQQQIAAFLDQHMTWPRASGWAGHDYSWPYDYGWRAPRPTAEDLARELLGMAEFRALQLGTWLGTTDGQIITEAVELVAPPFYEEDIELLVAALEYAARLQHQEGQQVAGRVAVGAAVAAGVVAVGIVVSGRAA